MFDIKRAKEEAEKEYAEEKVKLAKEKIKAKLKQLDIARNIVHNLQRELDDLYIDISQNV